MMSSRTSYPAFSLVEVVVALGIFAFCVVAIVGLLGVGLGATRSVANETAAVNIAESIYGAWQVQRDPREQLTVTNLFTNFPALIESSSGTSYFDGNGVQLPNQEASTTAFEMAYSIDALVTNQTVISTLQLEFKWPTGASPNSAQTRSYSRVFIKDL